MTDPRLDWTQELGQASLSEVNELGPQGSVRAEKRHRADAALEFTCIAAEHSSVFRIIQFAS